MMNEDSDYELVPDEGDQWNVRLLTEYPETVIRFGTIRFDGKTKTLRWNMSVVYSPDPDVSVEDADFQEHCGKVLQNIMDAQISKGNAVLTDRDTGRQWVGKNHREDFNEYRIADGDFEESADQ